VQPEYLQLIGMTMQEWVAGRWVNQVHPEDFPIVVDTWRRAVKRHQPMEGLYRIHMSRHWHWTVSYGEPVFEGTTYVGHSGMLSLLPILQN
jgi:PAS fold